MSKIGGWHNCYNSDRAISNELGGKWELFFEETREEAGNAGYEWDLDHTDDTPLNLNGIKIVATTPSTPSSTSTFRLLFDNTSFDNFTAYSTSQSGTITATAKIDNGVLTYSAYQVNAAMRGGIQKPKFIDAINNFAFSLSNCPVGTEFKVYVLRGV